MQNALFTAYQILVGQLDWIQQVIGALLMLGLCLAVWAIGWHRRQRAAMKHGMASVTFIALCFAVALVAVGGGAYGLGLRVFDAKKPRSNSASEIFVKEPVLSPWADSSHPLVFLGTPTLTTDRLRVVVEYSIYRNGWMSPVRFEVDSVKEPVKGKRFRLPITRTGTKVNGGVNDMWWGTDPQSDNLATNNPVYENTVAATLTRGRIVIIGPDNKEQNATYFEIVRGLNDQNGNIRFMVLQGRAVSDWVSEWEKET